MPSRVPVKPVPVTSPVKAAVVVPVRTPITSASASFLIVTSLVEPWPVRIKPSAAVYPMAALSDADVSPSGSKVVAVATPDASMVVTVAAAGVPLPRMPSKVPVKPVAVI